MPPGINVSHTQRQTWDFNVHNDLSVYLLHTLLCRIVSIVLSLVAKLLPHTSS